LPGTYTLSATATDAAGRTGTATRTVSVSAGETVRYVHTDAAGTPVAASDQAGNLLWRQGYRPYGERVGTASGLTGQRVGFHGKEADATGLQYFGARYYDPVLGRFLGVDPAGFDEGNVHSVNRYAYGNNNPFKYRDPDGKWAASIVPLGLAAAALYIAGAHRPPTLAGYRTKGRPDLGQSILWNESAAKEESSEEGCIYCVKGDKTSSGKDYVGSSDNMGDRQRDKSDGRDREGAEVVDTYPKGDRDSRRAKEQQAINDRGGVDKLDNKRNEVAPKYWPEKGIAPP
jgi:RHS repeat-associated protein